MALKEKIGAFALAAIIAVPLALPVGAVNAEQTEEAFASEEVHASSGDTVIVKYPEELTDKITEDLIGDLINGEQVNDGDTLTIWQIGEGNLSNADSKGAPVFRAATLWDYTNKKSRTSRNVVIKDYFVRSVAKGQTTRITTKITKSAGTEFGATVPFSIGEFGATFTASLTATYTVGHEFKGPPESSKYNSREYRVKFYGDVYSWTQTRTHIRDGIKETRSGTAKTPTSYASYSIDHAV